MRTESGVEKIRLTTSMSEAQGEQGEKGEEEKETRD